MASPSLEQTIGTTEALISHLQDTLRSETLPASDHTDKPINPLALSSTAASLIKAQTTKLTLLALNKPFSASSMVQILNTISTSPLPALVTATQLCSPARFSSFARHELQTKAFRLLEVYKSLLPKIPITPEAQEARILASKTDNSGTSDSSGQKAALTGTGLIWEVCDEIVTFAEQGLGEMAARKMVGYRALFNDALEEIDEWLEDGKDNKTIDGQLDDLNLEDEHSDSASGMSFGSRPTKEIIPVADWALNVLNHITLLYPPVIKRRIRKFPELNGKTPVETIPSENMSRLDQLLNAGQSWSEQIDLVAEGLFENDVEAAMSQVDKLIESVEGQMVDVRLTWTGSEDEFTAWITQWTKKLSDIKIKGRPHQ